MQQRLSHMHASSGVVPQTSSQLSTQTSKPLTTPKPPNKPLNSNSLFYFTKMSWKHVEGKQDEDHTTASMHKRQLHKWCSEIDACVNSAKECEEEVKNTGFEDFFIGVCSKEGKGSEKASAEEQECSPLLGNDEVSGGESVCNRYLYDTYCCEGTKDTLKSETEEEKVRTIEEELGMDLKDEDIFELAKGLLEETTQQTKAQDHDSNNGKSYKKQSLICKKWVKTFSARIRHKNPKCK